MGTIDLAIVITFVASFEERAVLDRSGGVASYVLRWSLRSSSESALKVGGRQEK